MVQDPCEHWHGVTDRDRRRLDGLVGTLPGSVVFRLVLTPEGTSTLAYVSPNIEDVFALARRDVMANVRCWYDLIHPADRERVRDEQAQAMAASQPFRSIVRYVLPTGERLFEIHSSPEQLDDGCTVWNGVATDITEISAIRSERQRLLELVDATTDLIGVVRRDGTIETLNAAARRRLAVELNGDTHPLIRSLHDEASVRTLEDTAFPTVIGGKIWTGETSLKTPEGLLPVSQTVVGVRDGHGTVTHFASIMRDMTDVKAAENKMQAANEQVEVALREVNHRLKNFFALVPALVKLSARSSSSVEELADAIQARIGALSRSHTLTLNASVSDDGVLLRALAEAVLEPFTDAADAFDLDHDDVRLSGREANAVALALHELATNAAKHGVLSASGGRVIVRWKLSGDRVTRLALDWIEEGGPPVEGPPEHQGFGTSLLDRLIAAQGGQVEREWRREGVRVRITLPIS